ncbi:MAG: hypothetical protein K6G64_04415 [Eubacterium sp.]|nr:hypothetical protein [Eubacterium sp.]
MFQKGMSLVLAATLVVTGFTLPTPKVSADDQGAEVRVRTDTFTVEKSRTRTKDRESSMD